MNGPMMQQGAFYDGDSMNRAALTSNVGLRGDTGRLAGCGRAAFDLLNRRTRFFRRFARAFFSLRSDRRAKAAQCAGKTRFTFGSNR